MQLQNTPTIASPGQSGVAREGAKEPGRPHRRVSSGGGSYSAKDFIETDGKLIEYLVPNSLPGRLLALVAMNTPVGQDRHANWPTLGPVSLDARDCLGPQ